MNRFEFYSNLEKFKNNNSSLEHHGIKGQKWGVRRFQDIDGSYTEEGRKRYGYGPAREAKAGYTDQKIGGKSKTKSYFDENGNFDRERYEEDVRKKAKMSKKDFDEFSKITEDISERMVENAYKNKGKKFQEEDAKLEQELLNVPLVKKHFEEMQKIYKKTGNWDDAEMYYWNRPELAMQDTWILDVMEHNLPSNQKIGSSYKMSPWEKKAEKNRQKDLDDDYKRNKKSMSKDEFEEWKKETEVKEQKRKSDREEFAKLQDLKENIAKGKTLSEKEYNNLSEEGKKIYDASKEMKEYGWDVESNKDNPDSKYTQRVNLVFTKKLNNKDFGNKFSIHQKDLENMSEVNKKADKAIKFLNDKNSYNKIIDNLLEDQYKYYQEVAKRENRKNIMTKSEFIESEKPYVKEVGFDTWSGGNGSIAIDFEPKNPNTSWFGYGFEVWVDPNTGKVTDFYQS